MGLSESFGVVLKKWGLLGQELKWRGQRLLSPTNAHRQFPTFWDRPVFSLFQLLLAEQMVFWRCCLSSHSGSLDSGQGACSASLTSLLAAAIDIWF